MAQVLQARRNARGATAVLHRLLGLELKMKQYEVGEAFVNAIEREAGLHAIDPAWQSPEQLPTLDELEPRGLAGPGRRRDRRDAVGRTTAMPAPRCEGVELDGLVAPVVVACSGRCRLARAADPGRGGRARSRRGARGSRLAAGECERGRGRARRGNPARSGGALRAGGGRAGRQPRSPRSWRATGTRDRRA